MATGIILAGGKSTRMGEDKSMINLNVERLSNELRKSGCERIIVMCGGKERFPLFTEECVEDSAETLAESLLFVLSKISGRVQLAPCDAYLADAELFSRIDGVPTDEFGGRQPLLAGFNVEIPLVRSLRISEMFSPLKSCEGGIKARNINTPEQLREIQYLLQKVDR
ncbi:MAG: NTP transferase domain-containing protein [Euryarchaeota archaeon]|mgnify:FL=1|jgi:molybdopterin-guanine dinucleotide biosynthesis protein A|nr:NTP transferase domain-containing protein [Euryarchaeota archaeon]MBT4982793.1 NTP transferase domain-containing protein [Euryarchaeota archaeon]MBT5184732.1 NTP transferase domain-containing protein [Euryarchaeota archaeon]